MSPRNNACTGLRLSEASSLALNRLNSRSWALCWVIAVAGAFAVSGAAVASAASATMAMRCFMFFPGPVQEKGALRSPATPLRQMRVLCLPEEVVDHVDDLPVPRIDQDRVVIIADPAIARRRVGQPVFPRVVDPVAARIIARPQPPADLVGPVPPAERVVIEAQVEMRPVSPAPVPPVVLTVVPPIVVPSDARGPALAGAKPRLRSLARRVADDRGAAAEHVRHRMLRLDEPARADLVARAGDARAPLPEVAGAAVAPILRRVVAARSALDHAMLPAVVVAAIVALAAAVVLA